MLEQGGFEVVGEAADGTTAIAEAKRLAPELVLLDVSLPDMSGFDVAAALESGPASVVLVSSRDPADFGVRARTHRVCGQRSFTARVRNAGGPRRFVLRASVP